MQKRQWTLIMVTVAALMLSCSDSGKRFDEATRANTIEAYQSFIQQHPKSKFVGEARKRVSLLAFDIAAETNTEESFLHFIASYTDSVLVQKAREKASALAYENVRRLDKEEEYVKFLAKYPGSVQASEARNRAALLCYKNACEEYTEAEFQRFIDDYPPGDGMDSFFVNMIASAKEQLENTRKGQYVAQEAVFLSFERAKKSFHWNGDFNCCPLNEGYMEMMGHGNTKLVGGWCLGNLTFDGPVILDYNRLGFQLMKGTIMTYKEKKGQ